jgi:hypothetical protein
MKVTLILIVCCFGATTFAADAPKMNDRTPDCDDGTVGEE